MRLDISYSIVSHGHEVFLKRLLTQMCEQPSFHGVNVIITLNLESEVFDPSPYSLLNLFIIRNKAPKGFGENHNLAFSFCKTNWFGVLNPDLNLANQNPFDEILHEHQKDIEEISRPLGMIVPLIVSSKNTLEDSARKNLTPLSVILRSLGWRNSFKATHDIHIGTPFLWFAGMCFLIRAEAYRSIGGFDERFFLYCEDYDLCARLYLDGWTIRQDDRVRIIHEAQRDSHVKIRYMGLHIRSLVKVWLSSVFWKIILASLKR